MRQLLQHGLEVTAQHCQPSDLEAESEAGDGISFTAAAWWLLQRVKLLEQLDGLETFMELTHRRVDLSLIVMGIFRLYLDCFAVFPSVLMYVLSCSEISQCALF